jgi:2,3-diketo-5-methylthio-1-phosphopentane phosphatase
VSSSRRSLCSRSVAAVSVERSNVVVLDALHIFCDFDGTISTIDIGSDLFERFGSRSADDERRLMSGELKIRDYWLELAGGLREPLSAAKLDEYLRGIPIDRGFAELVDFAREHGIAFTIVSDGLDLYIERYLALNGVTGVDVWSNHAELDADGRMAISFPHAAEGCDCFCAACKRNVVLVRAHPDERIIYIGDGISDWCPAEHADVIFAKEQLAAYCNAHRLPHYPFKTLDDVVRQLERLLSKRRIRVRHQAALKRKKAWESE